MRIRVVCVALLVCAIGASLPAVSQVLGQPLKQSANGGGWLFPCTLDQQCASNKADFGFYVSIRSSVVGNVASGQLEYQDHNLGINVHGTVLLATIVGGTAGTGTAQFTALCSDQTTCTNAVVSVTDNGEPGTNDTFTVQLNGGQYNGYTRTGKLGGGNINVHSF